MSPDNAMESEKKKKHSEDAAQKGRNRSDIDKRNWSDIGQHQHSVLYARRARGRAAISGDGGLHHFPAETSE